MTDNMPGSNESEISLKTHFVYELIDPRDNKVFYVGMGKNKREYDHKAGDKDQKEQKIQDIQSSGEEVKRIIIGRYDTADEAFAVETMLIKWAHGYENLTNVARGKNHSYVRPHSQKVEGEYPNMPGIDREKTLNLNNLEYTNAQIQSLRDNKVFEKLESIQQDLLFELDSSIIISEPNIKRAQDPHLFIQGFSSDISIVLKLQLTGENCVISFVPNSSSKEDDERFVEHMKKSFGDNIKLSKGNIFNSHYLLIKKDNGQSDTTNYSDLDGIKNKLKSAIQSISPLL